MHNINQTDEDYYLSSYGPEASEDSDDTIKRKKILQRNRRNLVLAHLKELTLHRKQEEIKIEKRKSRLKRRIQLTREQLTKEASERRLMAQEDSRLLFNAQVDNENSTEQKSLKISTGGINALVTRLYTKAQECVSRSDGGSTMTIKAHSYATFDRDYQQWKRNRCISSETKVFVMTGYYPTVKDALISRGWYFNDDPQSPFFDLIWSLKSCDINQDILQPWQITNHFFTSTAITTKVGLLKSISSVKWHANTCQQDIIPRGYDLSDCKEFSAFCDDFKLQKIICVLKNLCYKHANLIGISVADSHDTTTGTLLEPVIDSLEKNMQTPPQSQFDEKGKPILTVNQAVWSACSSALRRVLNRCLVDDDSIDRQPLTTALTGTQTQFLRQFPCQDVDKLVTDLEWEIIESADMYKCGNLSPNPQLLMNVGARSNDSKTDTNPKIDRRQLERDQAKRLKYEKYLRDKAALSIRILQPLSACDMATLQDQLSKYADLQEFQDKLNGSGEVSKNLWIVKPAAKSRGRGICTFADLSKLLKYVEKGTGVHFQNQWVVQKYIENPLVIAKRKFDLRQWVLVTDWNPLTIYFYDEFYARFTVDPYDTNTSSLENAYAHLVNNSIGKHSENFNRKVRAENGEEIEGYMWPYETFREYIRYRASGQDLVTAKIKPRMQDIVRWSLMSALENMEPRKESFELYGFDFMVDDAFNAWLIEINSSPACDYSTPTTERYVKQALPELLQVVLDRADAEVEKGTLANKLCGGLNVQASTIDKGGWKCIHKGSYVEAPQATFGVDLTVKGDAIPRPLPVASTSSITLMRDAAELYLNKNDNSKMYDHRISNRLESLVQNSKASTNGNNTTRLPAISSKMCLNSGRIRIDQYITEGDPRGITKPTLGRNTPIESFYEPETAYPIPLSSLMHQKIVCPCLQDSSGSFGQRNFNLKLNEIKSSMRSVSRGRLLLPIIRQLDARQRACQVSLKGMITPVPLKLYTFDSRSEPNF